ncbi:hypothetical protein DBV05_g12058 [Lasiodiplodia theobromae]|uniref:Glutathione S-transferase UstS-like C-terminal domain-containing protein n=1 Tax=Lasiodiplodia theobromae TaxID=45133 RepID=A0A5N5CV90_9PEZI|nr:hypothetical protein DBV05_g12058 [Lasiodiplodia theobromae]
MDSTPIALFLESTYPAPPLTPPSGHDLAIQSRARAAVGPAFRTSITPRELRILSPRSQEYFRRTREAALGVQRLEELLEPPGKEEEVWRGVEGAMREVGEMMRTSKAEGPFVLGERPCQTDFWIAGALQAARVVDEGVWRRVVAFPGFAEVYGACEGWMGKMD